MPVLAVGGEAEKTPNAVCPASGDLMPSMAATAEDLLHPRGTAAGPATCARAALLGSSPTAQEGSSAALHPDLQEAIEFHDAIVTEGGKAFVGYETEKALANVVLLSEIPTSDLSNSLGVPRDPPEVGEAVQTIAKACQAHNIASGITASAREMPTRTAEDFKILGAGGAGGGLTASSNAALRAGLAART